MRISACGVCRTAWTPVVAALKHLDPGGRLVINAIRKERRTSPA